MGEKITINRFIILLAKHIKKVNKQLKGDRGLVFVDYKHEPGITLIEFATKQFVIDGECDIKPFVEQALKETACDGVVWYNGSCYGIMLYGKPAKEFNQLSRLIYKYSGLSLSIKDVSDKYPNHSPYHSDYLCYNPMACKSAIDFIKKNKKKYDRLYVDFKTKSFDDFKRKYMELRMIDDRNREKAKMNIYAISQSYYL